MTNLRLQKRLAASIKGVGKRRVWLVPFFLGTRRGNAQGAGQQHGGALRGINLCVLELLERRRRSARTVDDDTPSQNPPWPDFSIRRFDCTLTRLTMQAGPQ